MRHVGIISGICWQLKRDYLCFHSTPYLTGTKHVISSSYHFSVRGVKFYRMECDFIASENTLLVPWNMYSGNTRAICLLDLVSADLPSEISGFQFLLTHCLYQMSLSLMGSRGQMKNVVVLHRNTSCYSRNKVLISFRSKYWRSFPFVFNRLIIYQIS